MRKPKILLDFLRNSDPRLEIQSNAILACMDKNPYFTSPTPTLAEMDTATEQYSAALSAAQNRDRIHVQQKNKTRSILELGLKRLSNYVMLVAGDDRAIMVSSGFSVSTETPGKSTMGQVKDFNVAVGQANGTATMSVKPLRTATFYLYFFAVATDPIVWQQRSSRYPSLTIEGLLPLTTYLFRMVAQGIDDVTSETGIITKGVL